MRWLPTCVWVCLAMLEACQGYYFEQVVDSTYRAKRVNKTISVSPEVDILFVVDNSGSMVGEQVQLAASFGTFAGKLDEKFGQGKYRIALITTGMETDLCMRCSDLPQGAGSCTNDTGETGRFQDRLGHISWVDGQPVFDFESDPACRIVTSGNQECFYDQSSDRGFVLVGSRGCGYERGLAAMRRALQPDLLGSWNAGFLREDATLAVVVVSDEEDCGEPGDTTDGIPGTNGKVCYYSTKGVGPDGSTFHPEDPAKRPYALTPVQEYYDFLMGLKNHREGLVKFAAVVGLTDGQHDATTIEFDSQAHNANPLPVCRTPGCSQDQSHCDAFPGTRYLQLARLFGLEQNGFVDTICQQSFHQTMEKIATFLPCPRVFKLTEPIFDPALVSILVNDLEVPLYSCSTPDRLERCAGPQDDVCPAGECVRTWVWCPPDRPADPSWGCPLPDPESPGGFIKFASHYNPCDLITEGTISIELVYITE